MLIRKGTYKGFDYSIMFADKGDWGEKKNTFYIQCDSSFSGDNTKTHHEALQQFMDKVDKFLNILPETEEKLLDALEDCLTWTGYEDCHLDRQKAALLIRGYMLKHDELA